MLERDKGNHVGFIEVQIGHVQEQMWLFWPTLTRFDYFSIIVETYAMCSLD